MQSALKAQAAPAVRTQRIARCNTRRSHPESARSTGRNREPAANAKHTKNTCTHAKRELCAARESKRGVSKRLTQRKGALRARQLTRSHAKNAKERQPLHMQDTPSAKQRAKSRSRRAVSPTQQPAALTSPGEPAVEEGQPPNT